MDPIGSQPLDEDVLPRGIKRNNAFRFIDDEAREGDEEEQDEEDSDVQPDLGEYFSHWDISPKDQILMCRSYASYLSVRKSPFKYAK